MCKVLHVRRECLRSWKGTMEEKQTRLTIGKGVGAEAKRKI